VDNSGDAARGATAGSATSRAEPVEPPPTPEQWLNTEGLRIGVERMRVLPGVAGTKIQRWLREVGGGLEALALMIDAARRLERGGADVLLICSNTMHRMAEQVQAGVAIPLIHIADPTARRIQASGLSRIGLLGTAFTMEQDFYKGRLATRFGLEVLIPEAMDRDVVHRVIYDELVQGIVRDESRDAYRGVIARLVDRGAEAIILGCTEIMLLVQPEDSAVPLFDTTGLHAMAAVEAAMAG
jgi:aspartate racemase